MLVICVSKGGLVIVSLTEGERRTLRGAPLWCATQSESSFHMIEPIIEIVKK